MYKDMDVTFTKDYSCLLITIFSECPINNTAMLFSKYMKVNELTVLEDAFVSL